MKDRIFALVAALVTVACFYFAFAETIRRANSDRLEAIGGVEVYREQRLASLFRLLKRADQIRDEEAREREMACIQAQIDRLERGEKEANEEFGEELTVERFGN